MVITEYSWTTTTTINRIRIGSLTCDVTGLGGSLLTINTRILWQKSACVGSVQSSFSPSCCVHAGSSPLLVFCEILQDLKKSFSLS